jgi:hypothetical protein
MTTRDREMLLRDMEDLPGALLQEVADFVRFLKEKAVRERMEPALLSEPALRRDWLRPEEDAAWADL